MNRLNDRTAVVTGAASGIGREIALALARSGCDLGLVDLDRDGLETAAGEIRRLGRRASTHVADVADAVRMQALAAEVQEAHGGVQILVNNAGVALAATVIEHTLEDWRWILGVNLWGVIHGCHFFLPHLLRADEAQIVNVSSAAGIIGIPVQVSYCASKFAVRGLSESLREELSGTSVGVTTVFPGPIATNIAASARSAEGWDGALPVERFRDFSGPAAAAGAIVAAIRSNRARLLITPQAVAGDAVKRLAPTLGNRLAVRSYVRSLGMQQVINDRLQELYSS
jgi:short-subunit dehydrogenase